MHTFKKQTNMSAFFVVIFFLEVLYAASETVVNVPALEMRGKLS